MMRLFILILATCVLSTLNAQKILGDNWDAKLAGDKVMADMVQVTTDPIKGVHDGRMMIVDGKAYIVYYANNNRPGEDPRWNDIYIEMSIFDIKTMTVEQRIPMAKGGQQFDNHTLEEGSCFVPQILKKDERTLRCFFASEEPQKRQSQIWYIDFDMPNREFSKNIHKAKMITKEGVFDMQPIYFYQHALLGGYKTQGYVPDYGLYLFDTKYHKGKTYMSLVMFPWGPSGLSILNNEMDTFEALGCINEPLNEMSICFMPDDKWLSIVRNDRAPFQYTFWQSPDGMEWTKIQGGYFDPKGTCSKPTFDCFNGVYYIGWQSEERINDVNRSVFNIDVSLNGIDWERKYRFETEKSFQYPLFREYNGQIYFVITQGDYSPDRKERIMFGCLK